jgi:hypothetical protein
MNKYFALAALIFSVPPPGGDGSFHLREDDGDGVNGDDHHGDRLDDIGQLTNPHQEKFSLQVLYPPLPPATQRDSGKRTMGVEMSAGKKMLSLQVLYPPLPPARNGTPVKGRWGGVNDVDLKGLPNRPPSSINRLRRCPELLLQIHQCFLWLMWLVTLAAMDFQGGPGRKSNGCACVHNCVSEADGLSD